MESGGIGVSLSECFCVRHGDGLGVMVMVLVCENKGIRDGRMREERGKCSNNMDRRCLFL